MIKSKREALTKRWALFCAGNQFTDKDFVYRGQIIRNEDFRRRYYEKANIQFCSVLHTNLSGSRIRDRGAFIGNGWYGCSFSGSDYSGIRMVMEEYKGCVLGNSVFRYVQMVELQAEGCNYTGSRWYDSEFCKCAFRGCCFRKTGFLRGRIDETTFLDCVFDEALLEGTELSGVIFRNCFFRAQKEERPDGCSFQNCTFEKC